MGERKLSYQELEEQLAELKQQNELLQRKVNTLPANPPSVTPEYIDRLMQERDMYYGAILNKIVDPAFVKDDQSRIIIANDAFCSIFDLPREKILGKTLAEDVTPKEHEEFLRVDKQVLTDGTDNVNEETLTIRGGKQHTLSTKKSRFVDSHGKKFIVGVMHDITELKDAESAARMSEAQFRGLFTQSHVGSAVIGIDKQFLKCNKAFCQFLGYTEDELIGKTIIDITYPEDIEIGMNDMKRIVQGEIESAMVHKRYVRKGGEIVWGELTISLVRGEQGEPLYFLPVIQDMTERNKAVKAAKESEMHLKELNATKDKLFSIIGHDLRSPFNSIITFSELLSGHRDEMEVDEFDKFLGYITSGAQHALTLLDNLLSWAKTQTGQLKLEQRTIDLSSVMNRVKELSVTSAEAKEITLQIDAEGETFVYADANILEVILRNLVSNAIKFTTSGDTVTLSSSAHEEFVEVCVSDTGIGMDEKTRAVLFSLTDKVVKNGTANEKGSGLGLILCKEFVEKHGGKLWVESEPGKGSDFKFTLAKAGTEQGR